MLQAMADAHGFVCEPPKPPQLEADLKACVDKAKAWLDQQAPPKP
jgi:hypothetical protein